MICLQNDPIEACGRLEIHSQMSNLVYKILTFVIQFLQKGEMHI